MTALLLAVTKDAVGIGVYVVFTLVMFGAWGLVWLARPLAPARGIPEAKTSNQLVLAMGPAWRPQHRQAANPCPDCGGEVVVTGHPGEAVASCTSCSWSLTQRRNVA